MGNPYDGNADSSNNIGKLPFSAARISVPPNTCYLLRYVSISGTVNERLRGQHKKDGPELGLMLTGMAHDI